MSTTIPSAEQVCARLKSVRLSVLQDIAKRSGVPYRTLINIRVGATPNPGLETVRKFFHLLPAAPDTSTQAEAGRVASFPRETEKLHG